MFSLNPIEIKNTKDLHILNFYAENGGIFEKEYVACNKNCTVDILKKLCKIDQNKYKYNYIFNLILRHENCTEEILDYFFTLNKRDLNESILNKKDLNESIVKNNKCPIYILEELSISTDIFIRSFIAKNENCPIHILEKLSKDKFKIVKKAVAVNKNTPEYILFEFLTVEDKFIKMSIINNEKCTYKILKIIYKENEDLRENIIKHPNWILTDFE